MDFIGMKFIIFQYFKHGLLINVMLQSYFMAWIMRIFDEGLEVEHLMIFFDLLLILAYLILGDF